MIVTLEDIVSAATTLAALEEIAITAMLQDERSNVGSLARVLSERRRARTSATGRWDSR